MNKHFDTQFYENVLDDLNSNVYITDVETDEIVYMNEYMKKTFHVEDAEGRVCWEVLQSGMTKRCEFCKIKQLQETKEGHSCIWREKNTVTGRVYLNHDSLERCGDRTYHIQHSIDITDQLQLSMEAAIDELTGVLNRNTGKKCLGELLKKRRDDSEMTVALYDINGLKWVNDTYGHLEGDKLLVFVAQNIKNRLTGADFIFRLSGDEFIIVFVGKNPEEAGAWMADAISELRERRRKAGITYEVSFSYGFAHVCGPGTMTVSEVLSIADAQMYMQKKENYVLKNREARINDELRIISDSSTDGIFKAAMTEGFPILYANDGYYEIHGYTREQMEKELGNCAAKLVVEEEVERIQAEIAEDIRIQNQHIVLEYRVRRRDGNIAWLHVNAGIMPLSGGRLAMVGMVTDITERRRLERRLMRTEQLFQVARKHTRLSMWEFDVRRKRIIQTDASREIHGFDEYVENVPESLIACGYVHPDSAEAMRRLYQELEEGKPLVSAVIRVKANDKGYWWEKITYTGIQKSGDQVVWAVGLSEDVTAQREAEIRVFREESMRDLLVEGLLFSFRVNMARNDLEELWDHLEEAEEIQVRQGGYEEIYGRVLESIANEDDRKRFATCYTLEQVRKAIGDKKPIPDFEYRRKQKNGLIVWAALNFRVLLSPETQEDILFGYIKDIDSLKKRELSLKKKAEIDEVSGFYNFSTAKLLIEGILEKSGDRKGEGALLLLNVDNFRSVNEEGGFLLGDKLLRAVSDEISENIPMDCVKARVNGDMFLIFCIHRQKGKSTCEMAEELRKRLCRTYRIDDREFDITISAGLTEQFTEGMTFQQMYQYSLHALHMAKRNGKNQLLRYRDVEIMEDGLDIRITIDAQNYKILDLNATGKIAFGFQGNHGQDSKQQEPKCYELLHNRTEPCPFCCERISQGEDYVWDCFVPQLNRIMHVSESLSVRDDKKIKNIRLREGACADHRPVDSQDILRIQEECWMRMEKGEEKGSAVFGMLDYLGEIFRSSHILVYDREPGLDRMALRQTWKIKGMVEVENPTLHVEALQDLFQNVFAGNMLLIEDEGSAEYETVKRFYGEGTVPMPLLIAGIYDANVLVSLLVMERIQKNKDALRIMGLVTGFMRRIGRMYDVNQNYVHALQNDQRTGLFNYQTFMRYLQKDDGDVYSAFGIIGICVVDLKLYNEKYGVVKGDKLLTALAGLITEIFGRDLAFRVSGAHFLVLCPDMTYETFSKRYRQLSDRGEEEYPGLFATAKVWEQSAISVEKLQQQVEEKLDVARAKRRSENLGGSSQTIAEMRNGLVQAMENGRFRTYLQPKAWTATGEICGAEALIRYADDKNGVISPGRFLPALEKAGLVRYVDLFVLEDVCRILKEWMRAGWKPFPISLNYSRATILEPDILEETNRIVDASGIPRELIVIEVTETIASTDSAGLKDIVRQFSEAGYQVAMDDFGAEYSNIYALYSLDLKYLKLDRRIVSDIYHDSRARLVVEQVMEICRKLDIVCVAEGVETEEHLQVLREMACDVIQGYYLNKPLCEMDFKGQYVM